MKRWVCASVAALLVVSMLSGYSGRSSSSPAQAQITQAQAESQTKLAKAEETSGNVGTGNVADGGEVEVKESETTDDPPAKKLEITVRAYHMKITVKDYGTIDVALGGNNAPITVANFLKLAKNGFYDGLIFYRIMSDFIIQGGNPLGTGIGGSDEEIKGGFASNGVEDPLSHIREAVSTTRSQVRDSAGSQFFIVHEGSTFLDGEHARFGYMIEGMEVVDAICKDIQPADDNGAVPKENQSVIQSIEVMDQEVS